MDWVKFKKAWEKTQKENVFNRIVIGILGVALVLALQGWQAQTSRTRLVPPNLKQEAVISASQASLGYRESWAYYVASLAGNITPENAQFLMNSLETVLAPDVYNSAKDQFQESLQEVKRKDIAVHFSPKKRYWSEDKQRIFITGERERFGPAGNTAGETYTYAMEIEIFNGRPSVTYFDSFSGSPSDARLKGKSDSGD